MASLEGIWEIVGPKGVAEPGSRKPAEAAEQANSKTHRHPAAQRGRMRASKELRTHLDGWGNPCHASLIRVLIEILIYRGSLSGMKIPTWGPTPDYWPIPSKLNPVPPFQPSVGLPRALKSPVF
jgi:hypothetical protein